MSTMLRDLPKEDLPRERLIRNGPKSLSDEELISILLRTGTKGNSVKELSSNILKSCKSIKDLDKLTLNTLKQIKGLGTVKAVTLLASLELGKRVYSERIIKQKIKLRNAADVYLNFAKEIMYMKNENFMAIYLDTRRNYISHKILFTGTLNYAIIHPREVFKEALLESAHSIIIMHNHPGGSLKPSEEDNKVTCELLEAGVTMGIQVVDHIIVSEEGYMSYQEEGLIKYV